jgi:hypothetical protein
VEVTRGSQTKKPKNKYEDSFLHVPLLGLSKYYFWSLEITYPKHSIIIDTKNVMKISTHLCVIMAQVKQTPGRSKRRI